MPPVLPRTGFQSLLPGKGVYVWDESGKKYLDLMAGWGVTSLGHASPVISRALSRQGRRIIQCPDSWKSYSPARAGLLEILQTVLPDNLQYVFFQNSGCEANDAAIKLARKASGKVNVVSASGSFHGRTIGTTSATGNEPLRSRFKPLVEGFTFVPYNDVRAIEKAAGDGNTAAVILEPIQGEGGVNVPSDGYLSKVSEVCRKAGVYFIADEIQTGFFRTGKAFAVGYENVKPDIITMAKGMAGGFPFAAFAFTSGIMDRLEAGDHGGTYCGNPLGCAVSHDVIKYMLDHDIGGKVMDTSRFAFGKLMEMKDEFSGIIKEVRGKGLLIALELFSADTALKVKNFCFGKNVIINVTHGSVIRIFPALTISIKELAAGLEVLRQALCAS